MKIKLRLFSPLTQLSSLLLLLLTYPLFYNNGDLSTRCSAQPFCHYIDSATWEEISPYLLPEESTLKQKLDTFFSEKRATLNVKSMRRAGFIDPTPRRWTRLVVTKHPAFPGYIFKLYLDAQRYHKGVLEHVLWIQRIEGVNALRCEIAKHGWQRYFSTPHKWIYPLPDYPRPPKEFYYKRFLLIEEEMPILGHKENYAAWALLSKEQLKRLHQLLENVGLHDAKPDNIPCCKNGKLAFIDTQQIHCWPVSDKKIRPYLSRENLAFWKQLTHSK